MPKSIRNTIAKKLTHLASQLAQDRWIVHATASEYVLPEDLLHDACDAYRLASQHCLHDPLSESAIIDLRILAASARSIKLANVSLQALIESDSQWSRLREQAANCLKHLRFDLTDWERSQGLR